MTLTIIFLVFCIVMIIYTSSRQSSLNKQEDIDYQTKIKLENETIKTRMNELTRNYGNVSTNLTNLSKYLILFNDSKKFLIGSDIKNLDAKFPYGKIYSFSELIGYEIDKGGKVYKEDGYQTKTSTSSVLKRAVVGGVLLGGVGALAGAATAKKTTKPTYSFQTTNTKIRIIVKSKGTEKEESHLFTIPYTQDSQIENYIVALEAIKNSN
ncbi:MAG: hypothetical protein SO179_01860 [Bacteroidales bacterium]|nr:hypothetical protein [Bacteroidales bacterium]